VNVEKLVTLDPESATQQYKESASGLREALVLSLIATPNAR
jgi:hypothetical protein